MQSWYAAWAATADRVEALAARTRDSRSKGGTYMRASTVANSSHPPVDCSGKMRIAARPQNLVEEVSACKEMRLD